MRAGVERSFELRGAEQHQAVEGAAQMQRFGTAGNRSDQKILGDRQQIALSAGFDLQF
jgi:hypothetical protein